MKTFMLLVLLHSTFTACLFAQDHSAESKHRKDIYSLIDLYAQARERSDTVLLKSILTDDIDQLVSSGEWRYGIRSSMKGMMRSSDSNPGVRTLTIDKFRFVASNTAIADARYEIKNADGSVRKMWSTFVVVLKDGVWKITAIRNMLPAGQS